MGVNEPADAADFDGGMSGIGGPATWAALASVGLALYFYYVRGDKQRGQFIGLWPGTILGLATYRKVEALRQQVERHDHE